MRLLQYNNDGEFSLTQFFDDIPPICDTLTHMGAGGGHLQGHNGGGWSEKDWF
jgi:hypothetical protein